jgi:pimeloyl-ACP methyl ester carboxylesterase
MRRLIPIALMVAALAALAPVAARAARKPEKSGHIPINGVNYYYEIHGKSGEPVLLLHGGLGSIDMFGPVIDRFAKTRTVIAVDLHGHGRTALGERTIDLKAQGDDLAELVQQLGYYRVDVFGYSMGGAVGFRMAAQHPGAVRRLVLVSTGFAQDGFYPEMLPQQAAVSGAIADQMKGTPMYKSYVAVAPKPEEFPKLLDQMGALMRQPNDWSADVAKLTMPVMLIYADSDMYRPEHEIKFYQLLGGGLKDAGWQREHMSQNRLAILPNRTHYDIFFAPELVTTALPFLDGVTQVETWDELVSKSSAKKK